MPLRAWASALVTPSACSQGRAIDGAGHGCYQKTWMQAARRRLTHMSSEGGETSMERNPLAPLLTPRRSSRMSPLSVACGGVPFFLLRSSMSMAISSLRVERSRSSRLDWMAMSPPARSAGARAQVRQLRRRARSGQATDQVIARRAESGSLRQVVLGSMSMCYLLPCVSFAHQFSGLGAVRAAAGGRREFENVVEYGRCGMRCNVEGDENVLECAQSRVNVYEGGWCVHVACGECVCD